MNRPIANIMGDLWLAWSDLEAHADELLTDGHQDAAEELRREAFELGQRLLQIEGVISDYPEIAGGAS